MSKETLSSGLPVLESFWDKYTYIKVYEEDLRGFGHETIVSFRNSVYSDGPTRRFQLDNFLAQLHRDRSLPYDKKVKKIKSFSYLYQTFCDLYVKIHKYLNVMADTTLHTREEVEERLTTGNELEAGIASHPQEFEGHIAKSGIPPAGGEGGGVRPTVPSMLMQSLVPFLLYDALTGQGGHPEVVTYAESVDTGIFFKRLFPRTKTRKVDSDEGSDSIEDSDGDEYRPRRDTRLKLDKMRGIARQNLQDYAASIVKAQSAGTGGAGADGVRGASSPSPLSALDNHTNPLPSTAAPTLFADPAAAS
ncbi:unnamed protein product [Vitrella brassicaformis CCMP3155]|uniref:Uncharacterized protein n=1 Tax=Vitrella brassicaformis (strain CCMP3155) TaxID=1169540 RepID=A0A0G4G5B2_VITBC|nr:unnamed protein product [Vitrella brassicaformis CCMP3155]|eukprot:CEM23419.1 unnamed protein product [Vitrella brassicaformis CCMP3155]